MKMYCIFAKGAVDAMKGNRGKLAAQAGHAYLHAFWDAAERFPQACREYKDHETGRAYKICLVADTDAVLRRFEKTYRPVCGVSLVTDAGLTVFKEPMVTCLGIGPIHPDQIGDDLKALKVFI